MNGASRGRHRPVDKEPTIDPTVLDKAPKYNGFIMHAANYAPIDGINVLRSGIRAVSI